MSAVGRITESQNELTTSIDVAGARSIVRLLRGSDAQLFAGYGALDSIYDAPTTEAADQIAELPNCSSTQPQQMHAKDVTRCVISAL